MCTYATALSLLYIHTDDDISRDHLHDRHFAISNMCPENDSLFFIYTLLFSIASIWWYFAR